MSMTPQSKSTLSNTIHSLRAHLLERLKEQTVSMYRLQIENIDAAELSEEATIKRTRLENWIDEQVRAENKPQKDHPALKERFLMEVVKKAAYTHLNRHIYLRLLEGFGLREKLLTGGWSSQSYQNLKYFVEPLLDDETEGYEFILGLVFDDLAKELLN